MYVCVCDYINKLIPLTPPTPRKISEDLKDCWLPLAKSGWSMLFFQDSTDAGCPLLLNTIPLPSRRIWSSTRATLPTLFQTLL